MIDSGVRFGAATTLTAMETECDRLMGKEPSWKTR